MKPRDRVTKAGAAAANMSFVTVVLRHRKQPREAIATYLSSKS